MAGPACALCGVDAVVHWQRRPTADELSALLATWEAWKANILALADPNQPPNLPPTPDQSCYAIPVYACAQHAITIDLAAHIHQGTCLAPQSGTLPNCNCSPEALQPAPDTTAGSNAALPVGW